MNHHYVLYHHEVYPLGTAACGNTGNGTHQLGYHLGVAREIMV